MLVSKRPAESYAGDVLLLPIAGVAFWTLAYQLVLIVRWPAQTITWCFLGIAVAGFVALARLWTKTRATPGKGYRFHPSHLLVLFLRSEEHTSELQSRGHLVCSLLLEKKKQDLGPEKHANWRVTILTV